MASDENKLKFEKILQITYESVKEPLHEIDKSIAAIYTSLGTPPPEGTDLNLFRQKTFAFLVEKIYWLEEKLSEIATKVNQRPNINVLGGARLIDSNPNIPPQEDSSTVVATNNSIPQPVSPSRNEPQVQQTVASPRQADPVVTPVTNVVQNSTPVVATPPIVPPLKTEQQVDPIVSPRTAQADNTPAPESPKPSETQPQTRGWSASVSRPKQSIVSPAAQNADRPDLTRSPSASFAGKMGARTAPNNSFIGRRADPTPTTSTSASTNSAPESPKPQPVQPQPQQTAVQPVRPVQPVQSTQPPHPSAESQRSAPQPKQAAQLSTPKQPTVSQVVAQRMSPTSGRASTSQRPQLTAPVNAAVNAQLPKLEYLVAPPAKMARESVYATIKRRNRRSLYKIEGEPSFPFVEELKKNGQIFVDQQFKQTSASLSEDNSITDVTWRRVTEIYSSPSLFVEGFDPAQPVAGPRTDLRFLSILSALTPQLESLFSLFGTEHADVGVYTTRFFNDNSKTWEAIVVDDYIPCGRDGRPLFTSSSSEGEIWPMILEKAYAKTMGSYSALKYCSPDFVLNGLTGALTDKITVDSSMDLQMLVNLLMDHAVHKNIICCEVSAAKEDVAHVGLLKEHLYVVQEIKQTQDYLLVKLRDNLNKGHWNGDFSAGSSKWTPELMKEVGASNEDEKVFWMSIEDFLKYFNLLYICKLHPIDWFSAVISGEWKEDLGWRSGPHFAINTTQPGYLTVSLSQPQRFCNANGEKNPLPAIGFYLVKTKYDGLKNLSLFKEDVIYGGEFYCSSKVTTDFELPAGNYSVIPMTIQPKLHSSYTLHIESSTEFKISKCKNWNTIAVNGQWSGDTAGGFASFNANPQFSFQMPARGHVTAILTNAEPQVTGRSHLGFYIFKRDNDTQRDQVGVSPFVDFETSLDLTLNAGRYAVVPCTWDAGVNTKFVLRLYSSNPVDKIEECAVSNNSAPSAAQPKVTPVTQPVSSPLTPQGTQPQQTGFLSQNRVPRTTSVAQQPTQQVTPVVRQVSPSVSLDEPSKPAFMMPGPAKIAPPQSTQHVNTTPAATSHHNNTVPSASLGSTTGYTSPHATPSSPVQVAPPTPVSNEPQLSPEEKAHFAALAGHVSNVSRAIKQLEELNTAIIPAIDSNGQVLQIGGTVRVIKLELSKIIGYFPTPATLLNQSPAPTDQIGRAKHAITMAVADAQNHLVNIETHLNKDLQNHVKFNAINELREPLSAILDALKKL